ncbi:MAG: GLPGLI family protein [Chitinophagaceae bacterium]|jgi:GLPGLI family protein|nr:GLPGLI family protein [Chitinophagaceae bacterium]
MNIKIYFIGMALFSVVKLNAQQFINKAVIEFEVKANIKKTMGNNSFEEMIKDNLPTFKTGYYTFTFADNKSIYKFDRWDEKSKLPDFLRKSDEENIWYYNYNSGKFNIQKNVWGSNLNVEDSIPALQWRLTNESRMIAGFNCRKAAAKIFDSVYVFAFYTDEITIPGGPCSINGLPGMILGLTIPRLFTSWIATKVMLNGVQENLIKPVAVKKNYTMKILKSTIDDRIKDWTTEDNNDEEKQQKNRFVWTLLL